MSGDRCFDRLWEGQWSRSIWADYPVSTIHFRRREAAYQNLYADGRQFILGMITSDMSDDEVARRVRAVSYGVFQPSVNIGGFRFALKVDK